MGIFTAVDPTEVRKVRTSSVVRSCAGDAARWLGKRRREAEQRRSSGEAVYPNFRPWRWRYSRSPKMWRHGRARPMAASTTSQRADAHRPDTARVGHVYAGDRRSLHRFGQLLIPAVAVQAHLAKLCRRGTRRSHPNSGLRGCCVEVGERGSTPDARPAGSPPAASGPR